MSEDDENLEKSEVNGHGEANFSFESLQKTIMKIFPNLKTECNPDFLLLTPTCSLNEDMIFLPTFHCVITEAYLDKENVDVKLIAYNGKILKNERVQMNSSSFESKLIKSLSHAKIRLCNGVPTHVDLKHCNNGNIFIREYLKERVVIRSDDCQYALMDSDPFFRCPACAKSLSLKPEEEHQENDGEHCKVISFSNHRRVHI